MLKKTFILMMMLLPFSFYGQSTSNTSSSTAINANFSMSSIKAYQESTLLKIEDYYKYLALLSDASTSDALKKEVKIALFSLFKNNFIQVFDFTVKGKSTISLAELIEKIKNKNYSFLVLNPSNTFLSNDSWTTVYDLEIREENNNRILKCSQKVYFTPTTKRFGSIEKEVWTIKLGEAE